MNNVVKLEQKNYSLQFYDAGCKAIEQASCIDEVKEIDDKAVAVKAYARQVKNHKLEADAAVIRNRAQRKMGQLLNKMRGEGSLANRGRNLNVPGVEHLPTLKDLDLSRKEGARAVRLASIPETTFEAKLKYMRDQISNSIVRSAADKIADPPKPKKEPPSINVAISRTWKFWNNLIEGDEFEKLKEIVKHQRSAEQGELNHLKQSLKSVVEELNSIIRRL